MFSRVVYHKVPFRYSLAHIGLADILCNSLLAICAQLLKHHAPPSSPLWLSLLQWPSKRLFAVSGPVY